MPNSPTTLAAVQWLQTGQAPPQRGAEVARAMALLSGAVTLGPASFKIPLSPDIEMALLVVAEAAGQVELVQLLSEHAATKANLKHAKKILFRYKQRGVAVQEKAAARAPVSLATKPEPLPSYASSFDGAGGQLLFLGGWSQTDGPFCIMAMVSELQGLLSAYYLPDTSRTAQKELLGRLEGQFGGVTIQISDAFVAGRIRAGLDVRDARNLGFEGDQAEVRRALNGVEPVLARDIGFDLDEEDQALLQSRLAAAEILLNDRFFSGWMSPDEALRSTLVAAMSELKGMPEVGEVVVGAARAMVCGQWLPAHRREILADRMDMTALLLVNHQRQDLAILAIATAAGLRDPEIEAMSLGFVRATFDRIAPVAHLLAYVRGEQKDVLIAQPARAK